MSIQWAKLIPWLPALAAVLCGLCCTRKSWRRYAGAICVGSIAAAFAISVGMSYSVRAFEASTSSLGDHVARLFTWFEVGSLRVQMAYFIDPLTTVMLFVVTGVGLLVAIYATGYMAGDKGYARFFAAVSLFIFAMTTLVLADNLVLLYLGWEGVGLCSYLLIGYYYEKPAAVAAAKKAFIVNRIGDLGFALGIFLTFQQFGTIEYVPLFKSIAHQQDHAANLAVQVIPFLLMLGALGKSAQIPLYVWLPDAMEGPTPVSALIHAATMVTSGVYMIARLLPVFELSPYALPTVAVIGAATALVGATIALAQYDLKKVFAYSTVSQLGYMFLGVGVLSTTAGVFHLVTHAFFKALLFLTAGSVMHALTGQLDMRKISGLGAKMPVTKWLMFAGCLSLAGFPMTAGFYSKDLILGYTMEKGLGEHGQVLFLALGIVGLVTALLTAFYTFRLWFRVFTGPTQYEMGDDHHGDEDGHGHDAHGGHGTVKIEHVHDAHEMPWIMNGPLVVLAIGALVGGFVLQMGGREGVSYGWIGTMIQASTADPGAGIPGAEAGVHGEHASIELWGMELHKAVMVISSVIAVVGILGAAYFHWLNRAAADRAAAMYAGVVRVLNHKYYVDELYQAMIVTPLRGLGGLFYLVDRMIIDGLVAGVGMLPRLLGLGAATTQRGVLQGYGLGMAAGAALIALLVILAS